MSEWVEVLKAKGQPKDKISELEGLIENVRNAKDELQQRNNLVLLRRRLIKQVCLMLHKRLLLKLEISSAIKGILVKTQDIVPDLLMKG